MNDNINTAHPHTWPNTLDGQGKMTNLIRLYLKAEDGPLFVTLGYHYLMGNNKAYWSITASGRGRCGCLHEEITALRPDLQPFVDMHLRYIDGLPSHAVANGVYYAKQYLSYALGKGKAYEALVSSAALGKTGSALVDAMASIPMTAAKRAEEQREIFKRHFMHSAAEKRLEQFKIALCEQDLDSKKVGEFITKSLTEMVNNLKDFYKAKSEELYQLMKAVAIADIEHFEKPEKTFQQVLDELGVLVKIERIKERSEGIEIVDSQGKHFLVTITRSSLELKFEFSIGSARKSTSTAEVIHCVLDEYGLLENFNTFDRFCRELGYDTDSRKALAAWERLEKTGNELEQMFNGQERADLMMAAEDEMNRSS